MLIIYFRYKKKNKINNHLNMSGTTIFSYEQLNHKWKICAKNGKKIYLDDLLKKITELKINEKTSTIIDGIKMEISPIKNKVYKVFVEKKHIFEFFSPVKLVLNEKTHYDIYSPKQLLLVKAYFIQCKFKLYSEEKKEISEKDISQYSGKTLTIELIQEEKLEDQIFLRENDNNTQIKLKDLTLNYIDLFTENDDTSIYEQNVFQTERREKLEKFLEEFMFELDTYPANNYIYLCGRSGIGKTVTFLDFRYKNRNVFYINLRYIFKNYKSVEKIFSIIRNELLYFFMEKDDYNKFLMSYEEEIFQIPLKSRDQKSFIYETLNKTIFSLIHFFQFSTIPLLFIIDQYKPRYDYYNSIVNNLKVECKENNYLKFIACSSNNELDVREIIYNSLFDDSNLRIKYITIDDIIDDYKEDSGLTEEQKNILDLFGKLPRFYSKIKNYKEKDTKQLIEYLKKEIFDEMKHSLKKINLGNNTLYGLLIIMKNEGKELTKSELKDLFKYICLKFMNIIPDNQKEDIFKDYSSNESQKFVIKYSFPILKDIFIMLIKEFKKTEYKQTLLDCNGAEEGYILEKLVYYSFDKNEKVFQEQIEISNSIEIDQVFKCSKIFLDTSEFSSLYNSSNNSINLDKKSILENLIEPNKNYHLYQRNTIGPKFDGALLLSLKKNNNNNQSKEFDTILYQSTKTKIDNRVNNEEICFYKDMIVSNLELIFNIKIRKYCFFYILEYENPDNSLIKFCEQIENQLNYIFYSLQQNKFVNKKGKEISIKNYLHNIQPMKNYISFIPKNNERNIEQIKSSLYNLADNLSINENNFLSKKRRNDKSEILSSNQKNNFISFFDKNNKQIYPNNLEKNKHTKYNDENKKNKENFFNSFKKMEKEELKQEKELDTNDIITTFEEKNSEINNKEIKNKEMNEEQIINYYKLSDIFTYNVSFSKCYFTKQFNEELNDHIFKIINNKSDNKKYSSIFVSISKLSILNNTFLFPFYFLAISKSKKEKYIILKDSRKDNDKNEDSGKLIIYSINLKRKLDYKEYYEFINELIEQENFHKNYLLILCGFNEEEEKEKIADNDERLKQFN